MVVSPDRIVDYLRERSSRPLKLKELARALDVPASAMADFEEQLRSMEDQGLLYQVRRWRYAAPERINLVIGRLQTIRSGAAFVVPEGGGDDVFVPAHALGSALDGDRVAARVERRARGRREGRVIKVLERARSTIVGMYHPARNFGFVVPEDRKITRHLFVPPGSDGGAREGDVVVARVTSWGDEHIGPAGEVERVLGAAGEPSVDTLAILFGHELPLEFPPEVEEEAGGIRARGIPADELARREDLRHLRVFTIDPADARDFDDALSIRDLGGGRAEVGVHIADVSAYVSPGSAIDHEALLRGTSVYLVDRVVPMLPDVLSGDLCSLKPGEERLAISLLMELDSSSARMRDARLVRSVIRSRQRLSYEDAQRVLDGGDPPDEDTGSALRALVAISRVLRENRLRRGSLDFDLPEARVLLDAVGQPTGIQRVERLESHRLIEDFMLLANETVAEMAVRSDMPFVFRIHERPDPGKIAQLKDFAATFGHRLGGSAESIEPKDLQRLLEKAAGRPEHDLLSTIILRSMKQARYGTEPLGHFGLAAERYTHFTAPIRRYPDLMVHRLLAHVFIDGASPESIDAMGLADVARRSSERERIAAEAERDSIDLKKVEYMERHLGERFTGTISGVTAFGLFVLLDDVFVEGLVHVSNLEDDFYHFVEDRYALIGERTRRMFRLGDPMEVRVVAVDRSERRIEFLPVELRRPRSPRSRSRRD